MSDSLNPEELRATVNRIVAELLPVSKKDKLRRLKEQLQFLPPGFREAAETLVLQTETIVAEDYRPALWEKIVGVSFGGVFILLMLVVAIFVPSPTSFQIFIFRVVLALAAAGVAAIIPGFLHIESHFRRNALRAGGAIAVFVLIYLVNAPHLFTGK